MACLETPIIHWNIYHLGKILLIIMHDIDMHRNRDTKKLITFSFREWTLILDLNAFLQPSMNFA